MYVTISKGNTTSCNDLATYLSKEDKSSRDFADYLEKEDRINESKEGFFNGEKDRIDKESVVEKIDTNVAKLSKDETRFYSLTINPSKKELEHIQSVAHGEALKIDKSAFGQKFWDAEKEITKNLLKEYTTRVMDEYAKNFGREGLNDNKDLVWFGKVESDRYWKFNDKEVRDNKKIDTQISRLEKNTKLSKEDKEIKILELKKQYVLESDVRKGGKEIPIREMMPKNGNNYHIHVIVSRKDKEQKYKLSPLSKARSNDAHKLNGKECKIGFDRNNFAQNTETTFDKTFEYNRAWRESLEAYKLSKENPELYKEKVKEELKNEYKQRESRTRQENKQNIKIGALYQVANKAGLQYLNHAQPYIKIVQTSIKGIKVIRRNAEINRRINAQARKNYQKMYYSGVKVSRTAFKHSLKGVPLNPYLKVASVAANTIGKVMGKGQNVEY